MRFCTPPLPFNAFNVADFDQMPDSQDGCESLADFPGPLSVAEGFLGLRKTGSVLAGR